MPFLSETLGFTDSGPQTGIGDTYHTQSMGI